MEVALKPLLLNNCAAFSRITSFLGLFFFPFGDAMSLLQIYQLSLHTKISFRFAPGNGFLKFEIIFMSLIVVGSMAFDAIETPFGKVDRIVGGSAVYVAYTASNFVKPIQQVSV